MKKYISIIIIMSMMCSALFFTTASGATSNAALKETGFISETDADTCLSSGKAYEISAYQDSKEAIFYKYDLSELSISSSQCISQARLQLYLEPDSEYTDGEIVAYITDNNWSASSLTYTNAPELENPVGMLSNINLASSSTSVTIYIDVTPYVSSAWYEGNKTISIAIINNGPKSINTSTIAPKLRVTYQTATTALDISKPEFYKESLSLENKCFNGIMGQNMLLNIPAVYASATPEKIHVYVASYNEHDVLIDSDTFEYNLYASCSDSYIAFPFKHNFSQGYTRAYVWYDNMSPLTESAYFTSSSEAYLTDLICESDLYPAFDKNIYEYCVISEDGFEEIPEITYSADSEMKVKKVVSDDKSVSFFVTSSDGNITREYKVYFRTSKSTVIPLDYAEVTENGKTVVSELPVSTSDEDIELNNSEVKFVFADSFYNSTDSIITSASIELWMKGEGSEVKVYHGDKANDEDTPLNTVGTVVDNEYRKYIIPLDVKNLDGFNSLNFLISAPGAEIWSGRGGVETEKDLRIPVIRVSYAERTQRKYAYNWNDTIVSDNKNYYKERPSDKYINEQNPPTFIWSNITDNLGYDLIVAKDENLNNVEYFRSGNSNNIYNFPCEFVPGTYWWSVRFYGKNGISEWQPAKRFTVRPDAYSFPVPELSYLSEYFASSSHPRLMFTENDMEWLRSLKDGPSAEIYKGLIAEADAAVKNPVLGEPGDTSSVSTTVTTATRQLYICSFAYLLTENINYANTAKKILLDITTWESNPDGATAYAKDDQIYNKIVLNATLAYDWLYNLLTDSERTQVENMLIERVIYMENPPAGLKDSPYMIKYSPYISHGWGHMKVCISAAITLADKSETLKNYIDEYLPYFIGLSGNQFGYEDGVYANGYAYWSYYRPERHLTHTLRSHGIVNIMNTANQKNSWLFPFYATFDYTSMEFGDDSYGNGAEIGAAYALKRAVTQNPTAEGKWKYTEGIAVNPSTSEYNGYYDAFGTDIEAKPPVNMAKSVHFKDAGYVIMHSDLIDNDRVSLYFRSSDFGSASHSHPDQNSFHIQAFGERLAIDSGYYDYYHSPFDLAYTRKTYAHNAITFDGGQGQAVSSSDATGKISNFITSNSFDLTSGEAENAYDYYTDSLGYSIYDNKLDRANRKIIYLRPDVFIVIDDLKAADNENRSFEWWLNAQYDVKFKPDSNGAVITQNQAVLEADMIYPLNIKKAGFSDKFAGPDGIAYTPSGNYKDMPVHQRVWFATEETNETKIVSVLNVHKVTDSAPEYTVEHFDGFVKLAFKNGFNAYIRTTNSDTMISSDGYSFIGDALIVNDEGYMLVDGVYLTIDGKEIIKSDNIVSVACENNNISVSSLNDCIIEISTNVITRMSDEKGNILTDEEQGYGISWKYSDGKTVINSLAGFHSLYTVEIKDTLIPITKY